MSFKTLNLHGSSVILIQKWKCCIMLKLQSKADVAMSTSCVIREAQLYRSQAVRPFFYSKGFFFLFCFDLALDFGLASCQCSQTPIPKRLVLPSLPAGVTLKDVKHPCCRPRAAVPALGIAGESPAPPSPCRGRSQRQHLEQPRAHSFLLAPSLSTAKRWKASPASCLQHQAIRQLV